MCDKREQLIGYVYEDGDATERQAVAAHLTECATCRREISALRRVRQDLLAWDVPEPAPVWRPVSAVRRSSLREQLSGWGLAAAAGFVLMAGAAGGAVTSAVFVRPAQAPAMAVAKAVPPTAAGAAISKADLEALEQKVLTTVRSEMDDRIRLVAAHTTTPAAHADGATENVSNEISALRRNQSEYQAAVYADILHLTESQRRLEQRSNFVPTNFVTPAGR